ncbi:MAG: hypothetical protein HYS15_03165 [Candidatus Spechtbacteria bacterium]|nr:hypothetical protein [Candidatus Spechtbacteria bacterium]
MMENKKLFYGILTIAVLVIAGIGLLAYQNKFIATEEITNFEECANAGYPIFESYPRQCKSPDGKNFFEKVVPPTTPPPTPISTSSGTVVKKSEAACGSGCNLPERIIDLEERGQGSKGSIFFAIGRFGTDYYSDELPAYARSQGFQTYRIKWVGEYGWGTGTGGAGFRKAMCGFSDVVKWVKDKGIAANSDAMCATGNSGGSFQISYGLSDYGVGDYLDMVILTGGPVGRWDAGCFDSSSSGYFPTNLRGRGIIDYMFGYAQDINQRTGPCVRGDGSNPDVVRRFQDESLVSPAINIMYSFPSTKVNFVQTVEDSSSAYPLAKFYYDAISSQKSWYDIPGTEHEVYRMVGGSTKMKELFVNECR